MQNGLKFILLVLLLTILAGCQAPRQEEIDSYRAKQIISSSFINFNNEESVKNQTTDFELILQEVENFGKLRRTELIYGAQTASRKTLVSSPKEMRELAYAWGEGDLKYHILLPGDEGRLLTETFSATTMSTYNFSYIINTPAKLVSNIRTDLYIGEMETGFQLGNLVIQGASVWFIVLDIFYALIGLILAIIMLPIGFIVGFITSPLQTLYDIFPSLIGLLKTMYYAVRNFFY
ncbi:hypothetical protein [Metabacillus bambusae]|uniref:Uncharacterized protein n=1 Tax=Metabacillus bambusae TaxID=2795218 RepID=A0ABS3NAV6_9BACI|nr:hypothetical protein [Metabacillus bambusae]MBO1515417.1 hypothetical protein [Metabacillus bambusae]